jgi:hypothetical protein
MTPRMNSILFLVLLSGLATGAFAQSAWTSGNPLPTASTLFSVAWTGTLHVAVVDSGALLTSPDGLVWTPRNSGTSNHLSSVIWTGTQLVAVGEGGAPKDPAAIASRMINRNGLSLRLTESDLFVTPPYFLMGRKARAAIYTLAGDKRVEVWDGADREIRIPIDNLAHGRYVFELRGAGVRMARMFER